MSEHISSAPDRDDLHDRLIDRSLRELVGGEAPPDLRERILAAAGATAPVALASAGGDAMNGERIRRRGSRFGWKFVAIAASLLVVIGGLVMPATRSARERAHTAATAPRLWADGGAAAPDASVSLDASELKYEAGGTANADFDSLVNLIEDAARGATMQEFSGQPADNIDIVVSQTQQIDDSQLARGEALTDAPVAAAPLAIPGGGAQGESASGVVLEQLSTRISGPPADTAVKPVRSQLSMRYGRGGYAGGRGGSARVPSQLGSRRGRAANETWHAEVPPTSAPTADVPPGEGAQAANDDASLGGVPVDPTTFHAGAPWQEDPNRMDFSGRGGRGGFGDGGFGGRGEGDFDLASDGRGGRRFALSNRGGAMVVRPESEIEARYARQWNRDQYAPIVENEFKAVSFANTDNRLSTFSIDVDTASYANVRQYLLQSHTLPPPDAVRIEELVNYFDYDYSPPTGDVPFAANVEVAACPWAPDHRLVRVGIKGREMDRSRRPKSNLVFLIDVSGSMGEPAKLPLLVEGMRMLARELGENDRVAIVVYASSEGLALPSTPGSDQSTILAALDRLSAGGSTAGGAGIQLAYQVADENFIEGGVNRVILCTDGDFNVGVSDTGSLQRLAEEKARNTGVFLTVLGFGRGNLNDEMMEAIADHGNGNYHYIDNRREARKVLVEEMTGTLVTIAKDVKIQIEFNPAKVAGYRLIGYENRVLAAEDFNDDKKDAGEIGAGHTVTALYEVVPAGRQVAAAPIDKLKYKRTPDGEVASATGRATGDGADNPASGELLTLKIRYKEPVSDTSTKLEFPVADNDQGFARASADFQFASAVASLGMLLRGSKYAGDATLAGVLEIAESSRGRDVLGYRKEFVEMVRRARELTGE